MADEFDAAAIKVINASGKVINASGKVINASGIWVGHPTIVLPSWPDLVKRVADALRAAHEAGRGWGSFGSR